jgi:hypothetical protein
MMGQYEESPERTTAVQRQPRARSNRQRRRCETSEGQEDDNIIDNWTNIIIIIPGISAPRVMCPHSSHQSSRPISKWDRSETLEEQEDYKIMDD